MEDLFENRFLPVPTRRCFVEECEFSSSLFYIYPHSKWLSTPVGVQEQPGSAPGPFQWVAGGSGPLCAPHGYPSLLHYSPLGFTAADTGGGNNKHHSDLVHSHWHSSTLNTARKVAPGGMLSKKPPLKGCTPHHVLVSPLEAHKAVAQLGSPLREMQ